MIAVSIVVHKTPVAQLEKAIECVLRCDAVSVLHIIDNSPDNTLEKSVPSDSRLVYRHVDNRGFGAGHNIAIRETIAAGTPYHLVLNADVAWQGDVLTPILNFMQSHPEVGLVSPKVKYPDGMLQYACRMLPTPADLFLKRFVPSRFTEKRMNRYLLADADHDKPFNVPYLLGSFMFFRTDALKAEGLFDERFFMYPEDIDISRRLHRHWKTLFWPGVEITHHHAAASRKNFRMLRIHLCNMVRYFNKWGWFFDRERRAFNRTLQAEMPRAQHRIAGRG